MTERLISRSLEISKSLKVSQWPQALWSSLVALVLAAMALHYLAVQPSRIDRGMAGSVSTSELPSELTPVSPLSRKP
jgi:hypothetical protein